MTAAARRRRQRTEILRTAAQGDLARAIVLARDHLSEFPEDDHVRRVVEHEVSSAGDTGLRRELEDLRTAP